MKRVVFDIETVGAPLESLEPEALEYVERREMQEKLGLYPLFAQVVAVAMLNPDTGRGVVFYQAPGENPEPFEEVEPLHPARAAERAEDRRTVRYEAHDEPGLLRGFWEAIKKYDQFITFNGRGFDCPFMLARSAHHRIRPTTDLMSYRFAKAHERGQIDLMDQLSYFGSNRDYYSLDMWCRFLGVESPKAAGVSGGDVKELFDGGRFKEIASYCVRDVRATAALFQIWEEYFRFKR